jgi:hypothetical protein
MAIAMTRAGAEEQRKVGAVVAREAEPVVPGAVSACPRLDLSFAGHRLAMLTPPEKKRSIGLL